ncbi:hypothetical protein CesoFtcFv8_019255 [Champsocephalus esox]|uniref:Uncharacterized protein n=1 Tax=Champsocephalus esox TaxID=159716 RepID=A0AAN8BIL7_9TELE|nr:hypothetical protein CesoFtcFv8_019255 [Champsocephalus esox]
MALRHPSEKPDVRPQFLSSQPLPVPSSSKRSVPMPSGGRARGGEKQRDLRKRWGGSVPGLQDAEVTHSHGFPMTLNHR